MTVLAHSIRTISERGRVMNLRARFQDGGRGELFNMY